MCSSSGRSLLLAASCLGIVTALAASPAYAQSQTYELDIPSQGLGDALRALGRATHQPVVFNGDTVRGKRSVAVKGSFGSRDALDRMLSGSDLIVEIGQGGIFMVKKAAQSGSLGTNSPGAGDVQSASKQDGDIVVTGSNIRGKEAAGSKLITITRKDIDQSGTGRIQDVMRNVSQNFANVDETVQYRGDNENRGADIELRGLGPGTTLTLINGQRVAAGGETGLLTDISSIPASLVDRIEILPEGASALYGSDAVGGVVNIILRKDFDGLETRTRFSTADGNANEFGASLLWGTHWSTGHVAIAYDYYHRNPLLAADTPYGAANGDFLRFGGRDHRVVGGSPGEIVDPDTSAPLYAIPRGQDGKNLNFSDLIPGEINYQNSARLTDILPSQNTHSAYITASQDINRDWQLSLTGRFARRNFAENSSQTSQTVMVPATNAFNRLGGPVSVAYDFGQLLGPLHQYGTTQDIAINAQIDGRLSRNWEIKLTGQYSNERTQFHYNTGYLNQDALNSALADSDPATALNLFGDGSGNNPQTLSTLSSAPYYEFTLSKAFSGGGVLDGTLLELPAGAVKLALGADYRHESVFLDEPIYDSIRTLGRSDSAVFAELAIPVFDGGNGLFPGRLDLSLAGRFDHYSDVGNTTNPKIGLGWTIDESIKLRGTWGTSFRAPPLSLTPSFYRPDYFETDIPDPKSPTGTTTVIALFGGGPALRPEKAQTWTTGFDFTPTAVKGLQISGTLYSINYKGRIQFPGSYDVYLQQESVFSPLIIRNPSEGLLNQYCSSQYIEAPCTGNIGAIIDVRSQNIASLKTSGIDFSARYDVITPVGRFAPSIGGTYTFSYKTRLTATSPTYNALNTVGNPISLKMFATLGWDQKSWNAVARLNYSGSYHDPSFTPARNG